MCEWTISINIFDINDRKIVHQEVVRYFTTEREARLFGESVAKALCNTTQSADWWHVEVA